MCGQVSAAIYSMYILYMYARTTVFRFTTVELDGYIPIQQTYSTPYIRIALDALTRTYYCYVWDKKKIIRLHSCCSSLRYIILYICGIGCSDDDDHNTAAIYGRPSNYNICIYLCVVVQTIIYYLFFVFRFFSYIIEPR